MDTLYQKNNRRIIDISWPITEAMTAYKDKKVVEFTKVKEFERDCARESAVRIGSHTGTHVDAPSHFMENGDSIDAIPLDHLIGRARVIDLSHIESTITSGDLEVFSFEPGEIVLIKTRNSELGAQVPFDAAFVYLDHSAAMVLANNNVRAVGIDYLGIERAQPGHETHLALMQFRIPIVEGLRLKGVEAGFYQFICLPLAIVGLEAACARAILIANQ